MPRKLTRTERRTRTRVLPDGATFHWHRYKDGVYELELHTPSRRTFGQTEMPASLHELETAIDRLTDEWNVSRDLTCPGCGGRIVYRYPCGDPEIGPPIYECPDSTGLHAEREQIAFEIYMDSLQD